MNEEEMAQFITEAINQYSPGTDGDMLDARQAGTSVIVDHKYVHRLSYDGNTWLIRLELL